MGSSGWSRKRLRWWRRAVLEEERLAMRITLCYLLFGVLWVTSSDVVVARLAPDPATLSRIQTLKGWLFVTASGLFLYTVTWWSVRARRKLRRRSRESQRFLGTLIENLPGVVYACADDEDWTMKFLSSGVASLTGYTAADLIGDGQPTYASLIHPADREEVRQRVATAVTARRPFQMEYRIRLRSGELRWVWEQGRGVFDDRGELRQLEGFIADVTERRDAQDGMRQQMNRLRALRAIDRAIMGSLDRGITLDVVLAQVTTQLEVDAAVVLAFNPRSEQLEHAAARGFKGQPPRHVRLRPGEGPAGRAALQRKPVRIPLIEEADGDLAWLSRDEGFVFYLAVPLTAQGQLLGVMELFQRSPLEPEPEWLEFLDTLAGQTAIALDNANLFEDLQRANAELRIAYDQTIEGWARALDLRDHETEGHSRRVMDLAVFLAELLEVDPEELPAIRHGALLHDIGKLAISDTVLLKQGPLDEAEREEMCRHPDHAVDLLRPIPFLQDAIPIPHCHHEWWDGGGYPRGLAGEEIPLAARIFSVVDVWDALRSDRPYRAAWSAERAREHLRAQSGSQFDPRVVEAFLSIEPDEVERIEASSRRRTRQRA